MSVIEFAEKQYKWCCENDEYEEARYWAAYLNGARAQKREYADDFCSYGERRSDD